MASGVTSRSPQQHISKAERTVSTPHAKERNRTIPRTIAGLRRTREVSFEEKDTSRPSTEAYGKGIQPVVPRVGSHPSSRLEAAPRGGQHQIRMPTSPPTPQNRHARFSVHWASTPRRHNRQTRQGRTTRFMHGELSTRTQICAQPCGKRTPSNKLTGKTQQALQTRARHQPRQNELRSVAELGKAETHRENGGAKGNNVTKRQDRQVAVAINVRTKGSSKTR